MKRYSNYKDSGVEWIGDIPEHWTTSKIKYLGNIGSGDSIESSKIEPDEGDYPVFGGNGIMGYSTDFNRSKPILVIGRVGEKCGNVHYSNGKVFVNDNALVFDPIHYKQVLHYTYHSLTIRDINILRNKNTQPLITGTLVKNEFIPLPPLHEQQAIVNYLDEKTTLIDELIRKKEEKIQLLKEKRTALINHVVTKGLDPEVEMKDSGVEWIGEVPCGWRISKLGFYTTKIGSGSTPRGGSEVYTDSGIPFIRSQNVHFDGLKLDGVSFIDPQTHATMKGSAVKINDVLLNITGGSIGRCCVVSIDEEMNVNQHVSIIRTTENLNPYFLNYLVGTDIGQSQVLYNISGGNREGLTIEGIRDFIIVLPPTFEQQQIVTYLDEQTQLIDTTIQREEQKIELLKEYRQSLISNVVTGKVCVCG